MRHESDKMTELRRLIEALCEDTITPGQANRLEEMVLCDPESEAFYIRYMHLHADLARKFGGSHGVGGREAGDDPAVGAGVPRRRALPLRRFAVAAIAACVLLAPIPFLVRRHPPGPTASTVRGAGPAVARAARKVGVEDGLAVVVRLEGVRWEPSGGPEPAEGDLLAAGRYRLRSGRLTLAMLTGVALVAEGPADLDLVSSNRVYCRRGKLRARVPEGSEGFVVSGPGSALVDMGTEFGVNVRGDGKSRGKVFEGEVEAAVLGTSGAVRRSQMVKKGSDAFEIDPETGRIAPLTKPEDFIKPRPVAPPSLTLDPSYPDAVRESRPWCYWRFESMEVGTIPNDRPGAPPLRVVGPIDLSGGERGAGGGGGTTPGNHWARFRPGETTQYLELDGAWKPERASGYAIELWFLSETIAHAAIASLVAPADTTHHLSLVELTSRNRLALFRPATVRFLFRWPAGRDGGDNMFSGNIYVPYRWHHLVAQVGGDRMELFLDGVAQSSQPLDAGSETAPCQFLLGRLTTLLESSLHHTGYRRPFVGLMDEVALYNRPLTLDEVRGHHRRGIPSSRPAGSPPAGP